MSENRITLVGITIIGILQDTSSIRQLIKYLIENHIFDDFTAPCRKDRVLYDYQISQDEWERVTGIPIENTDFLPNTDDGSIFVDKFYDLFN